MVITLEYAHRFITSAAFSILVETAALFAVFRALRISLPWQRIAFAGFVATFATIPYVWFVLPNAGSWTKTEALYAGEAFAVLFEALFYRLYLGTGWRAALLAAFAANAASYFLGPVLRQNGLWLYW